MASTILRKGFLLSMACLVLSACGGGGSTDSTAPTAVVTTSATATSDPGLIPTDAVITITFSESMDTRAGSWRLGGDLAGESNGGVWNMTRMWNNTLTIRPAASWFASPDRTLTVDARDLAGNALATLHLNFDVYRGTLYYVDASQPDDAGDGLTPATARQSLVNAVSSATTPATMLVNAGTYASGTSVILREGISLYGGYNANFSQREPATQVTTVKSTSAGARNAGNIKFLVAVYGDGSTTPITNTTFIDGFTLMGTSFGSGPTYAVLLENDANPTLQNNLIHGGGNRVIDSTVNPLDTNAIVITLAAPLIQKNRIHGGFGASSSSHSASAVTLTQSSARVINNLIYGGGDLTSTGSTYGITLTDASPILRNNTIHGGLSNPENLTPSYAITSSGTSHPVVQNNILISKAGTNAICYVESGNAQPQDLQNNSFYQCDVMYWDDDVACMGMAFCTSIDALQSMADITGGLSGNVIADPMLADFDGADDDPLTLNDNDWHFSATSPVEVTAGGLNGIDAGWTFTADMDGVTRPASGSPWSMGAYQ